MSADSTLNRTWTPVASVPRAVVFCVRVHAGERRSVGRLMNTTVRKLMLASFAGGFVVQIALALYRSFVDRSPASIGVAIGLLVLVPAGLLFDPPRWLAIVLHVVGGLIVTFGVFVASRVIAASAFGPEPIATALLIISFGALLLPLHRSSTLCLLVMTAFLVSFAVTQYTVTRESHHIMEVREETGMEWHWH